MSENHIRNIDRATFDKIKKLENRLDLVCDAGHDAGSRSEKNHKLL